MRRSARILSFSGSVAAVGGLAKIHASLIATEKYSFTGSFRFTWALGYIVLLALAAYAVGLPEQPRSKFQAAWTATISGSAAALGVSIMQLAIGDMILPRFVVFGSVLVMIPVHIAASSMCRLGRSRDEDRDRILLVAAASERERLVDDLRLEPERAAVLAGWLNSLASEEHSPGARPVMDAAREAGATLVVIDRAAQANDRIIAEAAALHESGVRVRTLQDFYEEWLGKLPISELERASLFFDIGELHHSGYTRRKRLLDIAVAAVGTLALVTLIPIVAVGNVLGNRGPLFYRQTRIGKGGTPFTMFKFRSMSINGASDWTSVDDPRVTPFGRILRRTHLDELPQMINILRGDLSIVGPRPEQPRYVDELRDKLAFYDLRHLVRPGLTGWAQVKFGYAGDERDALEKLQYEFFYLRHQDLRFDVRVIIRTLRSVAGGLGAGR